MPYDMTLFFTIASASASFVAIIGGFIASKLITINGERAMVTDRISELDEMIDLKLKNAGEIEKFLQEDDVFDYIKEHIEDLIDNVELENIYEKDKPQRVSFDSLLDYWNRARSLHAKFSTATEKGIETNDDNIPTNLAAEVMNVDFDYNLCKLFADYTDGIAWSIQQSISSARTHQVERYNEKSDSLDILLKEIEVLQLQREQFERQKNALIKPKKVNMGMWIFGGISIFNIFMPLLLTLLLPNYHKCVYEVFQYVSLMFLAIGLALTFAYLFSLLDWNTNNSKKDK